MAQQQPRPRQASLQQQQASLIDHAWRNDIGWVTRVAFWKGDVKLVIRNVGLFDLARREGKSKEHTVDAAVLKRFNGVLTGFLTQ